MDDKKNHNGDYYQNMLFPMLDQSESKERKRALLCAYALVGGLHRACSTIGVSPQLHYVWMKHDPEYVNAYEEAQRMVGDLLENAAFHRAIEGIEKPVFYQGEVVGSTKEYSDGLLKFLLKGALPQKYMDRADITSGGSSLRIILDSDGEVNLTDPEPAVEP